MTDRKKNVFMYLKFSKNTSTVPLCEGNNSILSDAYPEIYADKIILFNLNIINEQDAILRTFDHFPLLIRDTASESISQNFIEFRNSTLINIKRIYNYQIVPLKADCYFQLEQISEEERNRQNLSLIEEEQEKVYENTLINDLQELNEINVSENLAKSGQFNDQIAPTMCSDNLLLTNLRERLEPELVSSSQITSNNVHIIDEPPSLTKEEKELANLISSVTEEIPNMDDHDGDNASEIDKLIQSSSQMVEDEFDKASVKEVLANILPNNLPNEDQKMIIEDESESHPLQQGENNNIFPPVRKIIQDEEENDLPNTITSNEDLNKKLINQANNVPVPVPGTNANTNNTGRKSLRSSKGESSTSVNLDEMLLTKKRRRKLLTKSSKFSEEANTQIIDNTENADANLNNSTPLPLPHLCTICLDQITTSSKIDACDHEFCKDCIEAWAKLANSCPLCKLQFKKIIYLDENKQQTEKKVRKRKFKYQEEELEPWLQNCADKCMVCNNSNDEHLLLVCDRCHYNICHTYCANLDFIPDEDWICSVCSRPTTRRGASSQNIAVKRTTSQKFSENMTDKKYDKNAQRADKTERFEKHDKYEKVDKSHNRVERNDSNNVTTRRSNSSRNNNTDKKKCRISMKKPGRKRDMYDINISHNVLDKNMRKKSLNVNLSLNLHFSDNKKGKTVQTPHKDVKHIRKKSDHKRRR